MVRLDKVNSSSTVSAPFTVRPARVSPGNVTSRSAGARRARRRRRRELGRRSRLSSSRGRPHGLHRGPARCTRRAFHLGHRGPALYRYYDLQWGIPTSAGIHAAPGPIRVRPGEALAVALRNLDRGAPELYAHVFRIRADREIQPWSAGTGAQFCAARQHVDAADLRAGLARAYAVDGPLALPPGSYREWTLVVVSRAAFDIALLRTPVSARALPAGLQLTSKPSARGEGPPRDFDIVAFPYTLDLGRDSRL